MKIVDYFGVRNEPASDASIQEAADQLGTTVGRGLRDLYLVSDGGKFRSGVFLRVPDGSKAGSLYAIPVSSWVDVTQRLMGRSRGMLAWARDGSGNAIVAKGDDFFFWDHDTDQVQKLGDGEGGILGSLGEHPETSETVPALSLDLSAGLVEALASRPGATVDDVFAVAIEHGAIELALQCVSGLADRDRAMIRAAYFGRDVVVSALASSGASIGAVDSRTGGTALHMAASRDHVECVRVLLALGADKNARNKRNLTPGQVARITKSAGALAELERSTE